MNYALLDNPLHDDWDTTQDDRRYRMIAPFFASACVFAVCVVIAMLIEYRKERKA